MSDKDTTTTTSTVDREGLERLASYVETEVKDENYVQSVWLVWEACSMTACMGGYVATLFPQLFDIVSGTLVLLDGRGAPVLDADSLPMTANEAFARGFGLCYECASYITLAMIGVTRLNAVDRVRFIMDTCKGRQDRNTRDCGAVR